MVTVATFAVLLVALLGPAALLMALTVSPLAPWLLCWAFALPRFGDGPPRLPFRLADGGDGPTKRATPSHCHLPGGWPGDRPQRLPPPRAVQPNGMFLVELPADLAPPVRWLFLYYDPRPQGCPYPVTEGAELAVAPIGNDEWHAGPVAPHVVARSKRSPHKFKAFRSELDVPLGWDILDGAAEERGTWKQFVESQVPIGGGHMDH